MVRNVTIPTFNERAMNRISRAVRWVEQVRSAKNATPVDGRVDTAFVTAIVESDIEHNTEGSVYRAEGSALTAVLDPPQPHQTITDVYNPLLKVWTGARVLLKHVAIAGADPGKGNQWAIVNAFSATRIQGTITASAGGGAYTVGSVVALNGTYQVASTTVYSATGQTFNDGDTVIANLTWTGSESRWEIANSDASSGGSGFTRTLYTVSYSNSPFTPDTYASQGQTGIIINLSNSTTDGSVTGVNFNGTDGVNFSVSGEYWIHSQFAVDAQGDNNYPSGHAYADNWKAAGFSIYLVNGSGIQITPQTRMRGEVQRPNVAWGVTVNSSVRVPVASADTVRWALSHSSLSSGETGDADVRVFDGQIHIEKLS